MNVLELFAGVGGFRMGLENANPDYFRTLWVTNGGLLEVSGCFRGYTIIIFRQ